MDGCGVVEITGAEDAGYMSMHGKCLVKLDAEKLDYLRTEGWRQPP